MNALRKGDHGAEVREHQKHLNNRLRAHRDEPIAVDGHLGPQTLHRTAYAAWFLGATKDTIETVKRGTVPIRVVELVAHPAGRSKAQLQRARDRRDEHFGPLRVRAWTVAGSLLGVMEHGGNNAGEMVSKIIRANGGTGPEPWCGDLAAYCYRLAGSTGVDRTWAAVSLVGADPDVHKLGDPEQGDLVRFKFDHIGLFGWWCDANGDKVDRAHATHILTREGNTGASGAVSDSSTGGDGVYQKVRSRDLVADFLRVER